MSDYMQFVKISEEHLKERPVRVLEVWRQAFSGYWVAQLSNGLRLGAYGEDEIQAYLNATKWVEENINDE
jgi:GTP cyclohydrolase I